MACSKLEARGHLLHKTGTAPKQISREGRHVFLQNKVDETQQQITKLLQPKKNGLKITIFQNLEIPQEI